MNQLYVLTKTTICRGDWPEDSWSTDEVIGVFDKSPDDIVKKLPSTDDSGYHLVYTIESFELNKLTT